MKKVNILSYLSVFSLLFVIVYFVISPIFLLIQGLLPESHTVALRLYESFREVSSVSIIGQFLRGLAFALIFYPFLEFFLKNRRGKLIMFLSMWAVALIGSVEPQPGSFEGIIYTFITFWEHLLVILAVAIQMGVFVLLFFKLMEYFNKEKKQVKKEKEEVLELDSKKIKKYSMRFLVVHFLTYMIVGSIFYEISGYGEALETMEIFKLWRPQEEIVSVLLVFFGQIFRGLFLALLLYPFYHLYINKKNGWLLLFLLMFGLTALGSPLFLTEFILFEGTLIDFFKELVIGIPEIFSQMLVFSLIFFFWQKRVELKSK